MYSTVQGVTGEAFCSRKIVWSNNMQQLPNFMPSVDNLSHKVKDVKNVVIGPIFGHLKDWEDIEDKRYPIGII